MKINYRPEIDGLRAIAVLAVIIYHAQISINNFQIFRGGFIGVDIFFVISGYLITGIILKELISTGTFSFIHFLQRRIRRIIPALFVVIIASFIIAWFYLLPINFINFSKSSLFSIGFTSNFYFWLSGELYESENSLFKPLLHTWSLAVEEQFYIFFPIFLLLIFKFLRKYLLIIFIIIFILSLFLADWGSKNYPSSSFYLIQTRLWELLSGSILSYIEIFSSNKRKLKVLNSFMPSLGLFLILFSFLFYDHSIFHPSFITIIPIVGVCLIIRFANKEEFTTKILSTKYFVGFGLISYSLYLWHYPIFAFARIKDSSPSSFDKLEWLFLTLVISVLSYFFVEKIFRNKKFQFQKLIKILIFGFLIISISNTLSIINKGFENRKIIPKILNTQDPRVMLEKEIGKSITKNSQVFFRESNINVILVGDSHAESLSYKLFNNLDKNKYNLFTSLFGGCQYILNLNRVNKKTLKKTDCTIKLQNERQEFINKSKNSVVILFGRLPLILEEDRYYNSELDVYEGELSDFMQTKNNNLLTKKLRQESINYNYKLTINNLLQNNHKVIIVYPFPEVGVSVPKYIFEKKLIKDNKNSSTYLTVSYEDYLIRTKSSFTLLNSLKGKNIYRVYPHKLLCNTYIKNRCLTHYGKHIYYRDDDHPSIKGSEMISELILKELNKMNF